MTTDFKTLMRENFGELNARQLWALVRFAKNVRLRCRNNAAFNNFCNATFGDYAQFRTVTKTRTNPRPGYPPTYPGLEITIKGETIGDTEENGDE